MFCSSIFAPITLNSSINILNIRQQTLNISITAMNDYKLDFDITWGGENHDSGSDITLDDSGNIYITGRTNDFGAVMDDAYVARFDSSGNSIDNFLWGGSDEDYGYGITSDGSGNIYITGETWSFTGGPSSDPPLAFIAKFIDMGSSIETIWNGTGSHIGSDVALDSSGNAYIVGETQSEGAGSWDAFVGKFDNSLNPIMNIFWGGSQNDEGRGIALEGSGNIYIVGKTYSFGMGSSDAFIAKFDSSGNSLKNITWGGSNDDYGTSIALDGSGNIYITGYTNTSGTDDYDAFIAKYDSSGNFLMDITWGGNDWDFGSDITLDGSGNIYITGYTDSYGAGDFDTFILKYDSSGNLLTDIIWGGGIDDYGQSIVLDGSGNIYVTGTISDYYSPVCSDAFILKYIPSKIEDDNDDLTGLIHMIIIISIVALIGVSGGIIINLKKKRGKLRSDSIRKFDSDSRGIKSDASRSHEFRNKSMLNKRPHLNEQQPFFPSKKLKIGIYCGSCNVNYSIAREEFDFFSCGGCGNNYFNIGYFCRNCNMVYPLSQKDFTDLQEPETLLCFKCNNVMELLKSEE